MKHKIAICAILCLLSFSSYAYAADGYEVYVLFHEGTSMENIRYMLSDLGNIDGVTIMVNLYDNTTVAMDDAINRLESYLSNLTDYHVVVQAIYCFPYGYMTHHWQFELSSFSEEFYTEWYSKLDNCFAHHNNVKLFVGFNEAYFCFDKSDAVTIMQREYTIWKSTSAIPFSCEITFPFYLWHNYFNVTAPNFENDVLPIWQNYSDYIGMNLIAYSYSPEYGYDPLGSNRTKEAVVTALYYSNLYGKSVHCDEVLCWYPEDFEYVRDNLMTASHRTAVYKLWDWGNSTEWIYALYNINPETGAILRVQPTWNVYDNVINQQLATPTPTATPERWYDNPYVFVVTIGILVFAVFVAIEIYKHS